ncbi:MAG: NAD(P)/FAD-dependent oxidoreductase [Deltaproteobacteria bacterium]|nr:NAD(P)/FAD-dependent oxidoreductase [Deltaproteobacteria bacterium]
MILDYDVIVIGGGINGLTTAAYLGKAGLKTLVLEERGECGTHCDTIEPGIPGFLHNLQATEKVTGLSPCMSDLELEKFGYEITITDYIWGNTFLDGKNALSGASIFDTLDNWLKLSPGDAELYTKAMVEGVDDGGWDQLLDFMHNFFYKAPKSSGLDDFADLKVIKAIVKAKGLNISSHELVQMNGFQACDLVFDSEHIKVALLSGSWVGGFSPIHRQIGVIGTLGFGLAAGAVFPVHNSKGGSHALPHALIKCARNYGVEILSCCPVEKIIIENGQVKGVKLTEHAVYPNQEIRAKKVVSNLSLIPTFKDLVGEEVIGTEMSSKISQFCYEENVVFCVNLAVKSAPQFKSAEFDEGIQRCFVGYFGGENSRKMAQFGSSLTSGRIFDDELMANWLVPSLTDPSQAPDGCHTCTLWMDVPPTITNYNGKRLGGFTSWDSIKFDLADKLIDEFEKYTIGFKNSIIEKFVISPLDIHRNNQSALKGNWLGGSLIPGQAFTDRPLPGIVREGASRTFIKDLYLSNSIHPHNMTWLASGYIAACEVAEDLDAREQEWWKGKACRWYEKNIDNIPKNLGVG